MKTHIRFYSNLNQKIVASQRHRFFSSQGDGRLSVKYASFLKSVENNGKQDGGRIFHQYIYDNKVCQITIDNQKKRNSISGRMMCDIARIFDEILYDKKPLAVIIHGQGDMFCSGADLSLSLNEINTPEKGLQMSYFMTDALNSLRAADILSVALLNGPAIGGGAELATTCDWRIMNFHAYIQFVHAKIGASPGWGGAVRLINIVGRQHALHLLGTSERVDVDRALAIGLVDKQDISHPAYLVSGKSMQEVQLQTALGFLSPYLNQPYPSSVRGIKSIIAASESGQTFAVEKQVFGRQWASEDNKHAISKFWTSRQMSRSDKSIK